MVEVSFGDLLTPVRLEPVTIFVAFCCKFINECVFFGSFLVELISNSDVAFSCLTSSTSSSHYIFNVAANFLTYLQNIILIFYLFTLYVNKHLFYPLGLVLNICGVCFALSHEFFYERHS